MAFSADKGEKLYEVQTGRTGMAPPTTYEIDGQHYVAFLGCVGRNTGIGSTDAKVDYPPMLFVFAVDGKAELPAFLHLLRWGRRFHLPTAKIFLAAESSGELTMRVGVYYFPTDYGIDIRELARAAEERGFESLLLPEHTHIPKSRRTPFPGGGELPKAYSHTHDPFVALSFAAAATTKILLGTGICLIPQRDPIVTAKCVASLDRLSNGRFLFGIGGGWNVDEMENHGARYETRFKLMRDRILAMKALWTQEEAAFHGEMVSFDPVWLYPKPAQRPHPPILLGGSSDYTVKRVVEFCDGWLPIARPGFNPKEAVARLRQAASAAGRDFSTLSISVFAAPAEVAVLAEYRELGIHRAVLAVPDLSRDEIMGVLDKYGRLRADVS